MDDNAAVGCGLLATIALTLGVIGIYLLLAAAKHVRHHKVELFNAAVQRWQSELRHTFADATFLLNMTVADRSGDSFSETTTIVQEVSLRMTDALEDPPHLERGGGDFNAFAPLRHERRPVLVSGWPERRALRLQLESSVPSSGVKCTSDLLGGDDGIPLAYREARHWKGRVAGCRERLGGSFSAASQSCVTFHALERLCIKVTWDGRCWVIDENGGGYGCEPGASGGWPLGHYRALAGVVASGAPAFHLDAPSSVPPVVLRVRHHLDPRVQAANLTAGTFDFGTGDVVKATGGVELLIVSAALLTPAMLFFLRRAGHRAGHCEGSCCCCCYGRNEHVSSEEQKVLRAAVDGGEHIRCGSSCRARARITYLAARSDCEPEWTTELRAV